MGLGGNMNTGYQWACVKLAMSSVKDDWKDLEIRIQNHIEVSACRDQIDPRLIDFLIIAEDRRYGNHVGFDVFAIFRAIWRRVSSSKKEGASTISQQLVRTLTNRRECTIRRKLKEILLAVLVTKFFDPYDVAIVYLNVAYYGGKMNGLEGACYKLGLSSSNIPEVEAASLISRLKYPEPLNASSSRRSQISNRSRYIIDLIKQNNEIHKRPLNRSIATNEAI